MKHFSENFDGTHHSLKKILTRIRSALMSLGLISLICISSPASAVLTIEVTKGAATSIPIAVVPFGIGDLNITENRPDQVISSNLARSGHFEVLDKRDFLKQPHELSKVKYKNWRLLKAEALVIGTVTDLGDKGYEVKFRLLDVFREKQLAGQKFVVSASELRVVAHQISDIIYQKLIGRRGAFNTRIAYITVRGTQNNAQYLLRVADADGQNPRTILKSSQPIISPSWSPKGDKIAYVSFEDNRSTVYVQNLSSGDRKRVAQYPGINSAPTWSPKGDKLALTLSKDGNPEIYILDLSRTKLRRLTRNTSVDTEPAWSPDGDTIAFTSNRSGTPQIYQVAVSGGPAKRITFKGKYNAGATYSHDGKSMVLVTNQGKGFRVGLYSIENQTVVELTRTKQDESPTFAPNDDMIMYATQTGGRNVLAAVSPNGQVQQVIQLDNHSVREPAWSPFYRSP